MSSVLHDLYHVKQTVWQLNRREERHVKYSFTFCPISIKFGDSAEEQSLTDASCFQFCTTLKNDSICYFYVLRLTRKTGEILLFCHLFILGGTLQRKPTLAHYMLWSYLSIQSFCMSVKSWSSTKMAKKNHINKATQQPRDSFYDAKDLVEIQMENH